MLDSPHIALPFAFAGTGIAMVEQDSDQELVQAVTTVLRYVPGQRPELPEFGVPEQTFLSEVDVEGVRKAILRFEPRAAAIVDDDFVYDSVQSHLTIRVGV